MRTLGNHLLGSLVVALSLGAAARASFDPPVTSNGGGEGLSVGDIDGDGRDDLIAFNSGNTPTIKVLLSRGDGTFRAAASLTGALGRLCQWTYRPHLEDVNGDGHLDVAAFSFKQTSKIYTLPGWGTGADFTLDENVWLGRGDGTFAPLAIRLHYEWKAWQLPGEDFRDPGTFADFNRDGIDDLAALSSDRRNLPGGPVLVFLKIPTTADDPPVPDLTVEIGRGTYSTLASGDFDGDGWVDLVASNPKTLTTLLNNASW